MNGKKLYRHDVLLLLKKVRAQNMPELKEVEERLVSVASKMSASKKNEVLITKPIVFKKHMVEQPVKSNAENKKMSPPTKAKESNQVTKRVDKTGRQPLTGGDKGMPTVKLKKNTMLNGVVDASAIAQLNFSQIDIDGKYKEDFLELYSDTQLMFWGLPGHGKTVAQLKFAQYLAEKGLKVLYIAHEELNRSTLTKKIVEFKIGHKNLSFCKDLVELKRSGKKISDFDALFFDSIQSMGFNLAQYKQFVLDNPGRIYVLIAQCTKDGDFKGGKDWEHEVDIAGYYANKQLILTKNRLDPKFYEKSDRLMLNEKIQKGKKSFEVRQEVKKLTTPPPVPPEQQNQTVIYI